MFSKQRIKGTSFYRGEQVLCDGKPAVAVCKAPSQRGFLPFSPVIPCVSIAQEGVRRDVRARSLRRPEARSFRPGDCVLRASVSGLEQPAVVRWCS